MLSWGLRVTRYELRVIKAESSRLKASEAQSLKLKAQREKGYFHALLKFS